MIFVCVRPRRGLGDGYTCLTHSLTIGESQCHIAHMRACVLIQTCLAHTIASEGHMCMYHVWMVLHTYLQSEL